MKKCLILLSVLATAFGMERIDPSEEILRRLVQFHAQTGSSGKPKPNVDLYKQPRRLFIAKMDSFGLDRYFSFKTNADVDTLAEGVRAGGGWGIDWYYYDQTEDETTVRIQKIAPNTVVISDDRDDQ